MAKKTFADKSS